MCSQPAISHPIVRHTVIVRGTVQGVGFRPMVHRMAASAGLSGWIRNRSGDVYLCLEGPADQVAVFLERLPSNLPPNAHIDEVRLVSTVRVSACDRTQGFLIDESTNEGTPGMVIPPDLRLCSDCRRELRDPGNRRFGYPFTTCTACGPRHTVVTDMPYDRQQTTMAVFPLCEACQREYDDPVDRRFHAESIACPLCGPHLRIAGSAPDAPPLAVARQALASGQIVALRSLGGFQLAVDAFNRTAVAELRRRKHRPDKPLAVMARDLSVIHRWTSPTPAEVTLLESAAAPIVIVDIDPARARAAGLPMDLLTPDANTLGIMLPTSPLHELILSPVVPDGTPDFDLLVMTSGNRRSEPICISTAEAGERLAGIADCILTHNREVNLRCDDSVAIVRGERTQVWRRARGYAPRPVLLHRPLLRCVLAFGAEIKNTLALGVNHQVVISPHVGDLETPEAIAALERLARELPGFLRRVPEQIAVDLHPDLHASRIGRAVAQALGVPVHCVQHHQAHALSCLAEHGVEAGLVLTFDGTGYGLDGSIWGAELIEVQGVTCRRLATFAAVPLPGADAAVRQPVRQLVGRWSSMKLKPDDRVLLRLGVEPEAVRVWERQCDQRVHAPLTHSAGRLFDAFSAALQLAPVSIHYEGQPAIRLESAARRGRSRMDVHVPFHVRESEGLCVIDWQPAFELAHRLCAAPDVPEDWALAFHHAVARACGVMVQYGLAKTRHRTVGLSGGVFMNRLLTELVLQEDIMKDCETLIHREIPPNDGGISFGQAVAVGWSD